MGPIPVSQIIWQTRYRQSGEQTIEQSWRRLAHALATVEADKKSLWQQRFLQILTGYRFLPGGRILAGAGSVTPSNLFNCFVMGELDGDLDPLFNALKESALTLQQEGGIGLDFSTLPPAGLRPRRSTQFTAGPVALLQLWDSMSQAISANALRRGAMMGALRCDHPDIRTFIEAKCQPGALPHFNLSVLISDAFMQAIEQDRSWPLLFPLQGLSETVAESHQEWLECSWPGSERPQRCVVIERLPARQLWQQLLHASYENAEPGVLFIDRMQQEDNLAWCQQIVACNPCGEIPLPHYGACNLGSINLSRCVLHPFSSEAAFDFEGIQRLSTTAVRLLDNVIDLSAYPLPQQRQQARASRRIGLGITGLANALIMLGLDYRSEAARAMASRVMQTICHSAYLASTKLAAERGAFPLFELDAYLASPFIRRLPAEVRDAIARQGIRNSHLTAIAPAGSISLLAGNTSSGIEPIFALTQRRLIRGADGRQAWHKLQDYAAQQWQKQQGGQPLPCQFATADEITPNAQLAMQAALQPHVDQAISKTINLPEKLNFDDFASIYEEAWRLGLKGCTCYRPNRLRGQILKPQHTTLPRCCNEGGTAAS
ncbi:ribonucleoside-diphosphate reductase class II [endosymbiont of Ridgeia piscesae]|jgi:ribonucleoside-diphosphate reductase alpha chain|uniref:Vitamin B12-dependent ribonucleotide reductase n=3 Tax=endosymbiont of Ridgeia piscesae TaxID=54398 RepID=A0A0T5YZL0_9GAMM|nr:adenosylcobalamin-dependent ribonucleoside-diphosphate reductase [endosymbiont of Ridgeia piscesae]KRT56084.1 ribonucleoside-diphosphate reductase class II [endosymbiont of Ridgeia piscesae]